MNKMSQTINVSCFSCRNIGPISIWMVLVASECSIYDSDPEGVINIADPVTGTFVFMKLGCLKNFMSNQGSMKCP